MTDEQINQAEQPEQTSRPDPMFKVLTRLEAEQVGLQLVDTELQFTTRADFALAVPPGLALEGTLFDFFRALNVLEFKSEGDKFKVREYIRNEIRTGISLLQTDDEDYENILNVIVASRRPSKFLKAARKCRIRFRPQQDRPWLLLAEVGFQDVAIVVCRDLPLEKRYFRWLVFSPAGSNKWRQFVEELIRQGEWELLRTVEKLKPKELTKMLEKNVDIFELAKAEGYVPPQDPEIDEGRLRLIDLALKTMVKDKAKNVAEALTRLLNDLEPEERQWVMKMLEQSNEG